MVKAAMLCAAGVILVAFAGTAETEAQQPPPPYQPAIVEERRTLIERPPADQTRGTRKKVVETPQRKAATLSPLRGVSWLELTDAYPSGCDPPNLILSMSRHASGRSRA